MTEQKFRVSMPEITAMMRAPDHKNYRECGDQFLRYFLRGLTQRVHNQKGDFSRMAASPDPAYKTRRPVQA